MLCCKTGKKYFCPLTYLNSLHRLHGTRVGFSSISLPATYEYILGSTAVALPCICALHFWEHTLTQFAVDPLLRVCLVPLPNVQI